MAGFSSSTRSMIVVYPALEMIVFAFKNLLVFSSPAKNQ